MAASGGTEYKVLTVVVCLPRPVAWDKAPIRTEDSGSMALMREDFPTPDWPTNMLVLPANLINKSSKP